MNLCIFNIEVNGTMWNEDYLPTRIGHVKEAIEMILKTNYFSGYSIVLSDNNSTMIISPTNQRQLINCIDKLKPSYDKPHPLRCLRKSLFITQQRQWDSVHIVSFISSEQALSDAVLRRNELLQLKNYHVNFVLFGDVLQITSHTKSLIFSLVKRQGRSWKITEVNRNKQNPYQRLLMRMSEGIAIVPKRRIHQLIPSIKTGQLPSEFKASKYISCKIINYFTNDSVQMIPVPIVSKEKIISIIRCGKCAIEKERCVPTSIIGKMFLIEYSPILFKLVFRADLVVEYITIFNGEIKYSIIEKNGREFLLFEGYCGNEKFRKNMYWIIDPAQPFIDKLVECIDQEVPSSYMKIMETIWTDHKKVLSKMEEKYMNMKKEKEIANKVPEGTKNDTKRETDLTVRNEAEKKSEDSY
ncbi:hypothetical protein ENUP19_0265G0026 [Entamoeba nuttalli]|uniref:Uncharacterized protein n=2 Tax=Entamoeba nuttalli TaxID=412467 RepID=K2GSX7_ENTNP|nr:hypothetical protein ENU1_213580 [Entamoeba nuttalli P19]EKE36957.1 hypothetical protein ENU1_213580 [Entamoeba nuttalli P19]|eukprot:XP_008860697.1 hypothetical protein ENU1_213580 [Entamoeba nuttalli P19]